MMKMMTMKMMRMILLRRMNQMMKRFLLLMVLRLEMMIIQMKTPQMKNLMKMMTMNLLNRLNLGRRDLPLQQKWQRLRSQKLLLLKLQLVAPYLVGRMALRARNQWHRPRSLPPRNSTMEVPSTLTRKRSKVLANETFLTSTPSICLRDSGSVWVSE